MNINVNDIAITSLETITAFDILTGDFKFQLDELQSTTISQSQDTTDITGKGGRKLATLKRNKAVTVSGDNGLVSGGLIEMQTGTAFETKETTVSWNETVTIASNKATTSYIAIGTAGAEIANAYVKKADGTLGTALEQAATAAEGKFAYAPANKELTFAGLADGTKVFVTYTRKISANVHENLSDKYSTYCELFIDAFGEDTCSNVYRIQIHIPKADFDGNFDLEMSDNQTVHSFEATSLAASGCGNSAGNEGGLWTWTIFASGEADVTASGH